VRVVSVFRTSNSRGTWQKNLADLGLTPTPHWTDLLVADARESSLVSKLGIEQLGSESHLLDPRGKVVHSAMTRGLMVLAIEDSIAALDAAPAP
jgi:hypothetical protein